MAANTWFTDRSREHAAASEIKKLLLRHTLQPLQGPLCDDVTKQLSHTQICVTSKDLMLSRVSSVNVLFNTCGML